MTDEERERQDLLDKLRNVFQICEDAGDEIERLAVIVPSRHDASVGLIEAAELLESIARIELTISRRDAFNEAAVFLRARAAE